jgi:NDP-sugar pyrophosphorylase family protein
MQAIILAGGKGTRLKPYTVVFPKPLVPVGDRPILDVIIRQLVRYGVERVTISTGHLAELIEAYFGDGSRWNVKMEYVREDVPLNTAGALNRRRPDQPGLWCPLRAPLQHEGHGDGCHTSQGS